MVNPFLRSDATGLQGVSYDVGLRAHMQSIFRYMAGGLAATGFVAFLVANTALAGLIFGTPLRWVAILAPLVFMFYMNARAERVSAARLQTLFWVFSSLMGLSMGALFLIYTHESLARTFFITAGTFGAMSLWGYTTKRDLTGFGSFLMMGVLGLFIAMFVNLLMGSSMMLWITSVLGVAIFTGLTAYDVQRIKYSFSESYGQESNSKLAVMNALGLYLNFINAFQFLLSLTGDRR